MGMIIVPGSNNGYPFVEGLPPEIRSADIVPPYPDFIMRCLGSSFNNGYPLIMKLHNIRRIVVSDLAFADMHVEEMNFEGRTISEAFCNGQKVYGTVYSDQ